MQRKEIKKANAPQSTAEKRREYILGRLKNHAEVSDEEIKKAGKYGALWPTSAQSLKEDAAFFKRALHRNINRVPHQGKFVSSSTQNTYWTYKSRQSESALPKLAIGRLAGDLIRGTNSEDGSFTQSTILGMLKKESEENSNHKEAADAMAAQFRGLFVKAHRLVGLDSGTTIDQTALRLESVGTTLTPDPHSALKALTILTNSPKVAEILENPANTVDVILVGGRLRKLTSAYTGDLTDASLLAMGMRMDICMVGTTSLVHYARNIGGAIHHEYLGFHSDSHEESRTKSRLLEQSNIRVILMDASKFEKERSAAYPFASLSKEHVDLVITDYRVTDEAEENYDEYQKCINALWAEKIAVLVAPKIPE